MTIMMLIEEQFDNFTRLPNGSCFIGTKSIWEFSENLINDCKRELITKSMLVDHGLDEFSALEKVAYLFLFDEETTSNGNVKKEKD